MELAEILSDEAWRLRHLYAIKPKEGGVVQFQPNAAQEQFLQECSWKNVILKARQLGFSTLIAILFLDRLLFNKDQAAGIIDHTLDDAILKLDKIRLAYDRIGAFVDPDLNETLKRILPRVENSKTYIRWANGSSVRAGVSHTGSTLQYLHVSEFGKTAAIFPDKARQVKDGALPAAEKGFIVFESTHENGKSGLHYDLLCEAMNPESPWKFHFYPWWCDPKYRIENVTPRPDEVCAKYFSTLEREHGIHLDPAQQAWYVQERRLHRHSMLKEYPSVPSDVFAAPMDGAIYGQALADLRAQGRIADFQIEQRYPVWTFWDIGQSDFTAIWAVQLHGRDILWLDWYQSCHEPPSHYAGVMREWASRYPVAGHFLPHDAGHRTGSDRSYVEHLREAGLSQVVVVPRAADIWSGINDLRELLARSWFHLRTDRDRQVNGTDQPSGVAHLESYRRHLVEAGSILRDKPVHDEHSHTADAARTFAEAYSLGMVDANFPKDGDEGGQRAILAC